MATAGYLSQLSVRSDATAATVADEVDGITDGTVSFPRDMLESTNFKSGGWKTREAGLQDSSVDFSGHYVSADAPQQLLRSAKLNGTRVYVTVLADPSGTAGNQGWRIPMKVTEYTVKAAVGGLMDFTAKCVGDGAPTAI